MKPSIIQISPISLMETDLVLQKYACSANQPHCIILCEIISYTLTTREHFVFEMFNRNLPKVNKSVAMAKMLWNLSKQSKDTVPKQGKLNRAGRIP